MQFEFDEQKSRSNKNKHGIDSLMHKRFGRTRAIGNPLNSPDEPRLLMVGQISGKLWSAIITHRQERVRIISVRRARSEEKELYES